VKNNAVSKLGSSCNSVSLYDGYSKPTSTLTRWGDDICFALSYTEAANFLSRARFIRDANPSLQMSVNAALNNYLKIVLSPNQAYKDIWLRSPGDVNGTTAALVYGETLNFHRGTVFQKYSCDEIANIHPALWVESAVFDLHVP